MARSSAIESELAQFEHALPNLMLHMSDRHIREALAIRSGYRFSRACWTILEHLKAHGSMRAKALANMLGVGAPALSQHLKIPESAGLTGRAADSSDARGFIISLTSCGNTALNSIHEAQMELIANALNGQTSKQPIECAALVLNGTVKGMRNDSLAK